MELPAFPTLAVARVEAMVFRVPIERPVITSFGTMHSRPAVIVRVEDAEGAVGWGEVWCNFPDVGAEHRARLLRSAAAPLLLERPWRGPQEAFDALTRRLQVLAIQSGEEGPVAQVIAGIDMALWDLGARRLGQPLWRLLGGSAEVAVYASGLNPVEPEALAARKRAEGYRAFKLKVGFGLDRDSANLKALRDLVGSETPLMVDANQAWDADTAIDMAVAFEPFGLGWLEEPLRADAPAEDWQRVAERSPVPLAAGENIRGEEAFARAIEGQVLRVVQPDLGKWGGFSGCLDVGRRARAAGKLFCPHWLGGGVGLVASLHLKAAVGGAGYVEVDANDNPLREALGRPLPPVREGLMSLADRPGLGVEPDLAGLAPYRIEA
ncbi:mandelate racemase/muconate lactonizing enzyme family protein [Reyranella sp.]|uniref:mandelate racemase/muconate lactonizing enzyme family protein n=1 Tax=Reyranella sp. TaxID=1929291 RepID=UPI003BAC4C68